MTDALGFSTLYDRNGHGQVEKITSPDPGPGVGEDPLITQFSYTNGMLTGEIAPDGTSQSWTYDATFNQLDKHVDQEGEVTLYAINGATGNIDKIQQVIGGEDGVGNTETNDLITSFTYTTGSDSKPIGQVKTVVDPLGRTTEFT
jgi:YD repeat-containing protein